MPILPRGLGQGLVDRVKNRLKRELGFDEAEAEEPYQFGPKKRPVEVRNEGPPSGYSEILLRIRRAVRQDPPRLVYALYQAKDANVATWRHLAPYSKRDRGEGGSPLIFCACSKEGYAIEAFKPERFRDFQVTAIPWPPAAYHDDIRIEFRDD